ncbi:MAG: hypothetical protein K0S55_1445 [Clostridia bacterium]|nr:hypothetical protein [Clostridia bacterium]
MSENNILNWKNIYGMSVMCNDIDYGIVIDCVVSGKTAVTTIFCQRDKMLRSFKLNKCKYYEDYIEVQDGEIYPIVEKEGFFKNFESNLQVLSLSIYTKSLVYKGVTTSFLFNEKTGKLIALEVASLNGTSVILPLSLIIDGTKGLLIVSDSYDDIEKEAILERKIRKSRRNSDTEELPKLKYAHNQNEFIYELRKKSDKY